jgi:hypothetical protein
MRRDGAVIARQLSAGAVPTGLRRRARHQAMDAVFLELSRSDPGMLLSSLELLFTRNSADLVLRFLHEATTLHEEARIISSLPIRPYLQAALRTFTP